LVVAVALLLQGCPQRKVCSKESYNCIHTGCCLDPDLTCYKRDSSWASCMKTCEASFGSTCEEVDEDDAKKMAHEAAVQKSAGPVKKVHASEGAADVFTTAPPTPPPTPAPISWVEGTWTSAFWDCCKPSCAASGKGDTDYQVKVCHAKTGKKLEDGDAESVCDGGHAATCADNAPFAINENVSLGFASVYASGKHGLTGDMNCGRCYELIFTDERHEKKDPWGGAHPDLAGKSIVIQITNVIDENEGDHSFDIHIPGAGLRSYESGCTAQFPKSDKDDFDCGKRFGGCLHNSSCAKMPDELQGGCAWHHEWYRWMAGGGRTISPFVKFRRVRCPGKLTSISRATPTDDYDFPQAEMEKRYTE